MEIANGLFCVYEDEFTKTTTPKHYPHNHDFCELYLHIEGNCSFMVESGIHRLNYGTVVVTRSGELHSVRIDRDCQYERCHYHIFGNCDFLGTTDHMRTFYDRPFGENNIIQLSDASMDKCVKLIRSAQQLADAGSPDTRAMSVAAFLTILTEVNQAFGNTQYTSEDQHYNPIVSKALLYINQNFKTITSLNELADHLFVTREYLSRRFSKEMGVSLSKYLTMKRIEYAKHLLRKGEPLDVICEKCGWNDYSYFIYQFRKETGMTPSKFAKMNM